MIPKIKMSRREISERPNVRPTETAEPIKKLKITEPNRIGK